MSNAREVISRKIAPLYPKGIFSNSSQKSNIVLQKISNLPVLLLGLHFPKKYLFRFNFSFNLTR